MKKLLLTSLMLLLVLSGCDKKNNKNEVETLTADWVVESYSTFLKNGTTVKDVLTIADIINSEDLKSKYNLVVNFMNEVEEQKVATLSLKCLKYSDEYRTCINGSEKIQINGKPITIYEGEYYTSPTVTKKFYSYFRMDGEYLYYLSSLGFYETGRVGLYDLNGEKLLTENNAIEKYFTTNVELVDVYPMIEGQYFIYHTCDIEKQKIMKHKFNLTTKIGSVDETIDGYCNTRQSFFTKNTQLK